jgi:hypothetical protein
MIYSEIFFLILKFLAYGPGYRLADWNFSRCPANYVLSSYTSLKKALN